MSIHKSYFKPQATLLGIHQSKITRNFQKNIKAKKKKKTLITGTAYFAIDNIFHVDVTRISVGLDDYVIHDLLATRKGFRNGVVVAHRVVTQKSVHVLNCSNVAKNSLKSIRKNVFKCFLPHLKSLI